MKTWQKQTIFESHSKVLKLKMSRQLRFHFLTVPTCDPVSFHSRIKNFLMSRITQLDFEIIQHVLYILAQQSKDKINRIKRQTLYWSTFSYWGKKSLSEQVFSCGKCVGGLAFLLWSYSWKAFWRWFCDFVCSWRKKWKWWSEFLFWGCFFEVFISLKSFKGEDFDDF